MSNWKIKYDGLKEDGSAWYWHKVKVEGGAHEWDVVFVRKDRLEGTTYVRDAVTYLEVTEDYPNGPVCLNPDEVYKIEQAYQEELAELRGELFTLRILHGGDRR